jgi:hypothetical protein
MAEVGGFFLFATVQTSYGAYPASYSMDTGDSLPKDIVTEE